MKKIFVCILLAMSAVTFAENKTKPWSVYGNVGVGTSSVTTLSGLGMSDEDLKYFTSRGITPEFTTEGIAKITPAFNVGASRYFGQVRVSAQVGSQYINQSNYHATNLTFDVLGGYDFLRSSNELSVDLGVGVYNTFNNYVYNWSGLNSAGELIYVNGVPEQKSCNLGEHNTSSLSIPVKVSYLYNISGIHYVGAYASARYNFGDTSFTPAVNASVGFEYRISLGKKKSGSKVNVVPCENVSKEKSVKSRESKVRTYRGINESYWTAGRDIIKAESVTINNYYSTDTVFVNKSVKDTVVVTKVVKENVVSEEYNATVYFTNDSNVLSSESKVKLDEVIDVAKGAKKVIILGYADSNASYNHNVSLSINRAVAVFDYLRNNGVAPMKMSYGGASCLNPVDSNNTDEGRANNRRVEITVIY